MRFRGCTGRSRRKRRKNNAQGRARERSALFRFSAPTNRIRKTSSVRHHQDRVRRGVRRSQLHCASAEAAKAPYTLAPSSFPNCDRCAGSQFGDTGALPFLEVLFLSNINRKATQRSGRLSERKRKGADMKFSALAGNGMQRVSSDAAAVLFFLKKRKKRMGAQKSGRALPACLTT